MYNVDSKSITEIHAVILFYLVYVSLKSADNKFNI